LRKPACMFVAVCMVLVIFLQAGAFAQTIPKPSAPEFSVKLISHPYYVPSTSQTDPYTGAVTTYQGYLDENLSVEITIKNQPFTPVQMPDGNWSRLYYNIRFQGHFEKIDDWSYYPMAPEDGYINASNSEYTVISLSPLNYGQLDYQAQALIGYDEPKYDGLSGNLPVPVPIFIGNCFTGESSDWSSIQTITIGDEFNSSPTATPSPTTSTLPSQNPTTTPQPPVSSGNLFNLTTEQTTIVVMATVIAVLAVALVALRRNKMNPNNATHDGLVAT
jgi:hypothetical protein